MLYIEKCRFVFHSGSGQVRVCGGAKTTFILRDGSVNARTHRETVIAPVLRPQAGATVPNISVLCDDNIVDSVVDWFHQRRFEVLFWPAQFLDLNHIVRTML